MDPQLQANDLANMGEAGVDWIGIGDIVQHLLLPMLSVMRLFCLLAPVFGHSRVFKCHTPAMRKRYGHIKCRCSSKTLSSGEEVSDEIHFCNKCRAD